MKKYLFNVCLMAMAICSLVSCSDEDHEKHEAEELIVGKWCQKWNSDGEEVAQYYLFNANGTFEEYTVGALVNSVTLYGTYKFSADGKIVTLHVSDPWEDELPYEIHKLTETKLIWAGYSVLDPGFSTLEELTKVKE